VRTAQEVGVTREGGWDNTVGLLAGIITQMVQRVKDNPGLRHEYTTIIEAAVQTISRISGNADKYHNREDEDPSPALMREH